MARRKLRAIRLLYIVEIPSPPLPYLPKKGGKAPDCCRRPSPDGAVIDSPVKNDSVPVCPGIPGGRTRRVAGGLRPIYYGASTVKKKK